ncbi:MAG: ferritin-like protein [Gemmatimonadaceae bacterium]|nr:ferritin-like protein [Gemmatimonadaceae bacterium]
MPRQRSARREPAIRTIAALRKHLQVAMQLEHATIPPYFTAWLTIHPGTNVEAAEIIRSVMLEEMLHLTLAANLLNAVGGRPRLTQPGFVARYPHALPHSGDTFKVSIEKFSPAALRTFLRIERPEPRGAKPQPGHFTTIAQFYLAIDQAIDALCDRLGEQRVFSGAVDRQVRPSDYYGSGEIVVVKDRDSAHRAIAEIIEQGEGAPGGIFDGDAQILGDGDGREIAHYYRFNEVLQGRHYTARDTPRSGPTGSRLDVDFDAVYPIRPNARASAHARGTGARRAMDEFRVGYRALLASLERAFNGERTHFTEAIARMFQLHQQGVALARTPSGDGKTTLGIDFG